MEMTMTEIIPGLHKPPLSVSQGVVYRYLDTYIAKTLDNKEDATRELQFLEAAGECAVDVVGTITRFATNELIGILMPFENVIEPRKLGVEEKMDIFNQMRRLVRLLHEKGIIHGDIKLDNFLRDTNGRVVLCDFGTAAFVDEGHIPRVVSTRWCSPYRLEPRIRFQRPLIREEDIYALGITVWELFTGEAPFEGIDSDNDDDDSEDVEAVICKGTTVDVQLIHNLEVREFVRRCLSVFKDGAVVSEKS